MASSPISIEAMAPGVGLAEFIGFHHRLFATDPAWIAPLDFEVRDRLSPRKNPFFRHADARLFLARRGGQVVGRASAQIDREHLRVHDDATGFFGFFDTIDDEAVARALLDAARAWLKDQGMNRIRGPYSLSINEECGTLVEGFEHPPVIMMPHARPYQGALIEAAGLTKVKDLLAWRIDVEAIPPRAERALAQIGALPEVTLRTLRKRHMAGEVRALLDIFNDAWRDNWGFVPATEAEVKKIAADMKLIIDPELAFFAEIEGRPVAMSVCLPNLNEATRDFAGRLGPINAARLLWRLKVKRISSARLILLGIRRELRGKKRYGALSTALYAESMRRALARGYQWAEGGWTLEDNRAINLGIRAMGGEVYKRYRLYEGPL